MTEFFSHLLSPEEIKVRWEEPYVSEALNRKLLPQGKGIFRGFIPVVNGNNIELHVDPVTGDSVGVVETQNHYSVLVYKTTQDSFDFSNQIVFPVWIVLEVEYNVGVPTTGSIKVVDSAQLQPWHTKIVKVDAGLVISTADRDTFLRLSDDIALPVSSTGSAGISNAPSRSDHVHEGVHKIIAGSNVSITPSNGLGDVTVNVTLPPAGINGHIITQDTTTFNQRGKLDFLSPSFSISDDSINDRTRVDINLSGTPNSIFVGDVSSAGVSSSLARVDHKHGLFSGVPISIGSTNVEGTSTTVARADHIHEGVHSIIAGNNISVSPSTGLGDVTITANASNIVMFGTCAFVLHMGSARVFPVVGLPRTNVTVNLRRTYSTKWVNDGTVKDILGVTLPVNSRPFDGGISPDEFESQTFGWGDDGFVTVPNNAKAVILRVYMHSVGDYFRHYGVFFFLPGKQRPCAAVESINIKDIASSTGGQVIVPLDAGGFVNIRTSANFVELALIFIVGYIT